MKLSAKQIEFLKNCSHRWNFKGGAVRSGKTFLDFHRVIPMRIWERRGKAGLVVLIGVSRGTVERNVLAPMRDVFGPRCVGLTGADGFVTLFGEKCCVMGAGNAGQVPKIRGASLKYCYGDEVADWNQEVFELLKSRLDREYSCFDGTFNPQHPGHWLKSFLDSCADLYCQTYSLDDNPFLPVSFRENLKKEYAGTVFYDRYILGKWTLAEGLVYPMFREQLHVVDAVPGAAARFGKWYIAVDYGTVNPTAAGLWCVWQDQAWMSNEYYYDSRKFLKRRTDEEHYAQIEKLAGNTKIERIIVDPSAASFKETIRRHGRFAVWDADNRVLDGIRLTGSLLQNQKIKFCRCCHGLLDEFYAYRWDLNAPNDAVIKEFDHGMDQMRYLAATVLAKQLRFAKNLERR
ncbi:MAG: hypothetical protein K2O18_02150 [Oscillospiraceae bacterium]|nr:hypothetical protein [Oscillospiraceae bacterium]